MVEDYLTKLHLLRASESLLDNDNIPLLVVYPLSLKLFSLGLYAFGIFLAVPYRVPFFAKPSTLIEFTLYLLVQI